jgi:hypothetical protein
MADKNLQPGDVCRIIDHPEWPRISWDGRQNIGKTVTLLELVPVKRNGMKSKWAPFWRCAGMSPKHCTPSHKILEKIHPGDADLNERSIEEICEDADSIRAFMLTKETQDV